MLNINSKIFYQACMFGVVSVFLGLLLSMIFGFLKPELPKECELWDKYYVMEVIMFLTGFTLRYLMTNEFAVKYMYTPNDKI